jgi:hypothetical protein
VVSSDTPWFNANDVCDALEMGNPSQAIKSHVDADDLQKLEVIDNLGRTQRANHVNESGLYALILGSRKPESKKFKRWVTSEVLPSIRKTGKYAAKDKDWAKVTFFSDMPRLPSPEYLLHYVRLYSLVRLIRDLPPDAAYVSVLTDDATMDKLFEEGLPSVDRLRWQLGQKVTELAEAANSICSNAVEVEALISSLQERMQALPIRYTEEQCEQALGAEGDRLLRRHIEGVERVFKVFHDLWPVLSFVPSMELYGRVNARHLIQ